MPVNNLNRFFISIVLPSILAIGFFILSIFTVILPSFERNIMEGKKEMISELTNTAWSLIDEYYQEALNKDMVEDSAKMLAAKRIEQIRYGDEYKDYFWIIDKKPVMIMHPYRPELINTDLSTYKDPEGTMLFMEATKVIAEHEQGFINYMWQWKDDSSRIVPKLSYVKEFEPWDWIVGTGIYLEDVREEIKIIKSRLLWLAVFITVIISIILGFIIKQSLGIENKRRRAENSLRLSRQKYKSLVDASTEGTLLILKGKVIYSNIKSSNISGYDSFEFRNLSFEDIFSKKWEKIVNAFDDPKKTLSHEAILKCKDGSQKEVVISVSMISFSGETGYIIIIKELNQTRQLEKESNLLSDDLQTALLLMNQPILPVIKEIKKCTANTTVSEAAQLMLKKNRSIIFVSQSNEIIGSLNSSDLVNRVLSKSAEISKPVIEVMTSPVVTISEDALLYEVLLLMKTKGVSHLAVTDSKNNITGVIGIEDVSELQQNTLSFLINEIEIAEDINAIARIYKRVPVLIKALIVSGNKTGSISRIITSVSDAIHIRVLQLNIEDLGQPPCKFAFMVMGSEGRGEQSLATDQDNAIVFEDADQIILESHNKYFLSLGEAVSRDLHSIGYHYCQGDIMARNPKWTQPLSVWRNYFSEWINNSTPKDVLEAAIFFDFRFIFGEDYLINNLREHVNKASDNKAIFFYHMAQTVLKFKPPLNIFGQIVSEGTDDLNLDLKKVLLPLTSFIRLYSIREKLHQTNSINRLEELFSRKVIDKSSYEELKQTYDFVTYLRLKFQIESISLNEIPGNNINLNNLTRIEVIRLKRCLSEIAEMQTKVGFDFKGME